MQSQRFSNMFLGTMKMHRRTRTSFLIKRSMSKMKLLQSEICGIQLDTFKFLHITREREISKEIKLRKNK